jgi:hypothetical protein
VREVAADEQRTVARIQAKLAAVQKEYERVAGAPKRRGRR